MLKLVFLLGYEIAHFLGLQGDHSGCAKPPVDIKTKDPFLVHGPHTKTELLFSCQQEVGNLETT